MTAISIKSAIEIWFTHLDLVADIARPIIAIAGLKTCIHAGKVFAPQSRIAVRRDPALWLGCALILKAD